MAPLSQEKSNLEVYCDPALSIRLPVGYGYGWGWGQLNLSRELKNSRVHLQASHRIASHRIIISHQRNTIHQSTLGSFNNIAEWFGVNFAAYTTNRYSGYQCSPFSHAACTLQSIVDHIGFLSPQLLILSSSSWLP